MSLRATAINLEGTTTREAMMRLRNDYNYYRLARFSISVAEDNADCTTINSYISKG